jgi:hypothetical protein
MVESRISRWTPQEDALFRQMAEANVRPDTRWNMEDIVALIDARDERAKEIDAENAIA